MSITPIPRRRYIQKVLPTSYDDSLTYLEELGQLQYKINECIDVIDSVSDEWDKMKQDFQNLSTQVAELQSTVDGLEEELKEYVDAHMDETKDELIEMISTFETEINGKMQTLTDNVNAEIDTFESSVNNQLVDIRNTVQAMSSSLTHYIDNKVEILEIKHDADIAALNERIDTLVLEYPDILNPTNGLYEDINKVIEDVYSLARTEAITCTEFDNLVITCNSYDDMEITANNFDVKGKTILMG